MEEKKSCDYISRCGKLKQSDRDHRKTLMMRFCERNYLACEQYHHIHASGDVSLIRVELTGGFD